MKHLVILAAACLAACTVPSQGRPADTLAGSATSPETTSAKERSAPTLHGDIPIVIAHRGASGLYPEHTAPAYKTAIEQGADFIEPDLVVTSDGVLLARHDNFLSATTDIADHAEFADRKKVRATPLGEKEDWWVDDFTLAEIKTLKARQQFEGREMKYDGLYDILTFDEVMDIALDAAKSGRKVGLHVEAKWPGEFAALGFDMPDLMVAAMDKKGLKAAGIPVYIQCFEPPFLAEFASKSDLPTIQNMVGPPYAAMLGLDYKLEDIHTTGVGAEKSMILNADGTTSDFVERAHKQGLLVHVYTVRDDHPGEGFADSRAEFRALYDAGVDGVWTDYPATGLLVRDAE
ncbi:MAG: glycerophosphodiester phosphodiesterase [Alphaproteobacteria bacterium]|nr:glycerophosphodiester phosphodiesterase [Alphaproteobacteria bacterium]MBU2085186.1 glycerophosphodiester phosphodiesterase [Alphaproteobacteria bacterium]MBU2142116.1 glycerophosphodiester phosphodiesterase [Alphaproteobacteria bacterium]MBU2197008.1 glycerophosphodiester phosphodiesterase [Alphaproteobacteria bacterium]